MKKATWFRILLFLVTCAVFFGFGKKVVNAKTFITESKFKGTYKSHGAYRRVGSTLTITSIKNGRIKANIDDSTISYEHFVEFTTKKIKKNKATFVFTDNFGNKGKGSILFRKDGSLVVNAKTTKSEPGSRSEFFFDQTLFSKNKRIFKKSKNKLKDGTYFVQHYHPTEEDYDNAENMKIYHERYCERARIKDGKLTLWGSFIKVNEEGEEIGAEDYKKRTLKLAPSFQILLLTDLEDFMPISIEEFNNVFDRSMGYTFFIFKVKDHQVTKIFVTEQ